ncbi:MAG: ABC transporter transmembrane domain-containing protein [Bacillota bacterium]
MEDRVKANNVGRVLRRVYTETPHRSLIGAAVVSVIALSCTTMGLGHLLSDLLDTAIVRDLRGFLIAVLSLLGLQLLRSVSNYVRSIAVGRYSEVALLTLRQRCFSRLTAMPLDAIEEYHSGDIMSRLSDDLERLSGVDPLPWTREVSWLPVL